MAVLSQSGNVSPQPPGNTIMGSVSAPTRSPVNFEPERYDVSDRMIHTCMVNQMVLWSQKVQ